MNVASGAVFVQENVRKVGGSVDLCHANNTVPAGCRSTQAGTYIAYVTQYLPGFDPSQGGTVRLGLWRLDTTAGCPATGTSFARAPVAESFTGPDAVECVLVSGQQAERLLVEASGATDLSLQHQVYDSRGVRACLLYDASDCRLPRTDTYHVLTYSLLHQVADFGLSVASITRHSGCSTSAPRPFGTAPAKSFDLANGELFCALVAPAATSGNVVVRVHRSSGEQPTIVLYDTNGARACAYTTAQLVSCRVHGAGPYLLVISARGTATGSFGTYDLTTGTGCSTPDLAFNTAPDRAQLRLPGEVDCYAVAASPDVRTLRLGVASVPDGMVLHETVLDSTGVARCTHATTDYFRTTDCALKRYLGYRVLVWADEVAGTTSTGAYGLHLWLLTNPTGCTDLGSAANGIGPVTGRLRDGNDERCYLVSAQAGAVLHFTVTNDGTSDAIPAVDLRRPDGRLACQVYSANGTGTCTLSTTTRYSMVVFGASADPDVVRYRITATTG